MTKLPRTLTSNSAEQTEQIGRSLAELISQDSSLPRFIALYGDLGVGKTAFVRGFTSLFAKNARVKSPTFALVNEYKGESVTVFHFDMYRITDEDELYSIGFYDYLNRGGIALVEWSENIEYALPQEYFSVRIEKCPAQAPDTRKITLELIK
ncbi:MAG: tRNA (adenosine(37)-N6)-threonylcarbamoyltransferase complex ATPase subunit type 1 TsaE [Clostridia bacterium]|jgi:tRNA threonylcarbamoyladenosine biosynthesis protein TsaE|nr:tRNA (adenosine(37)-N6)-threonylcarbamoyltransferase complex ATPase subunit type 1 TsaE [Clostridia bacterium]